MAQRDITQGAAVVLRKAMAVAFATALALAAALPLGAQPAEATGKTASQGVDWALSQVGKSINYDGAYGAQCVDLAKAYYAYLGVSAVRGNGGDYVSNALPAGWTRVKGGAAQAGDVLVYTGGYGHVAICASSNVVVDQNYDNCHQVRRHNWAYNSRSMGTYWGYIRPNWSGTSDSIGDDNGHRNGKVVGNVSTSKTYYLVSALDTGKCVDVNGGGKANGNKIQLYKRNKTAAQKFKFEKSDGGTYRIKNTNSGKYLDAQGSSLKNSTPVHLWERAAVTNQMWFVESCGGSWYSFRNKNSNLYLDVRGGATANGTQIQQYMGNSSKAQLFKLVKA